MTVEIREYMSEGHRLLCESAYSPAEIANLSKLARQRVSEWRSGRKRPDDDARAALERAIGIPARAWDAAPVRRTPAAPAPPGPPPPRPSNPDEVPFDLPNDLPSLGLEGLERLARRLANLETTLQARDRLRCVEAQARVVVAHEGLRQKLEDARRDYLASPEFAADVRALGAAIPGAVADLRASLAVLGVEVAVPDAPAVVAVGDAPESLEELLEELQVGEGFRKAGEVALARAHVAGLGLDLHADAIASMLLARPELAPQVLELLEPGDAACLRRATERAMAVTGVKGLSIEARGIVATLLKHIGHEDLAEEVTT